MPPCTKDEIIKRNLQLRLKETEALITISGGDARKLLNLLEIVITALLGNDKQKILLLLMKR